MYRDWTSRNAETYAEALWFLMHRSFDPLSQAFAVTCYVDTSATDDKVLDHAIFGGVLLNRAGFLDLDARWNEMLAEYKIEPPFHTNELCASGTLSHIVGEARVNLLTRVASLINECKIHTLAVSINNRDHENLLSEDYRKTMRVYPMGFIATVTANQRVAQLVGYQGRIAYVLDAGTKFVGQVINSHRALLRAGAFQVGPLAIEDDRFVTALQASDVVAWVRRRIESDSHLPADFEPLLAMLVQNHVEVPITQDSLSDLARKVEQYGIESEWPLDAQ